MNVEPMLAVTTRMPKLPRLAFGSRAREWRRTAPPPGGRRREYRHLDGMRGLAALFVVFHHSWLTLWPGVEESPSSPVGSATRFLAFGHFAVVVFIVLSGFCLALPVARRGELAGGARGFLRRRARRIMPPYYASFALSAVLVWTLIGRKTGTHWDISVPVDWRGYAGNGLLLGDVLGGGQLNHVWWSVALESQIYLVFPLLVACWLVFGAGVAAVLGWTLAAGGWILVTAVPAVGPFDLAGALPWFLGLFSTGMLAAAIAETDAPVMRRLRERGRWRSLALVGSAGVVAVCVVAGRTAVFAHLPTMDVAVGAVAACIILAGCREGSMSGRVLGCRPLVVLGSFSYSLYLIHAPLLQLFWQYELAPLALGRDATFLLLVLVGVPLIVGVSYLFFLAFERPFLSRAHRDRLTAETGIRSGHPFGYGEAQAKAQ